MCIITSVFLVSFFFSSRRRYTRFSRDWSSDVCSSDLADARPAPVGFRPVTTPGPTPHVPHPKSPRPTAPAARPPPRGPSRSYRYARLQVHGPPAFPGPQGAAEAFIADRGEEFGGFRLGGEAPGAQFGAGQEQPAGVGGLESAAVEEEPQAPETGRCGWLPVDDGQAGNLLQGDPGLRGALAHARARGCLARFDDPAGELPARFVGGVDEQYAVLLVEEQHARGDRLGGGFGGLHDVAGGHRSGGDGLGDACGGVVGAQRAVVDRVGVGGEPGGEGAAVGLDVVVGPLPDAYLAVREPLGDLPARYALAQDRFRRGEEHMPHRDAAGGET